MRDKIIVTLGCGVFAAICFGIYARTFNIALLIIGIVLSCTILLVDFGWIIGVLLSKRPKSIKTINFYVFIWFIIVAAIGALGAALLFNILTYDNVQNIGIIIAFGIVFSIIAAIGVVGAVIGLANFIRLKIILLVGEETTAQFLKFQCKYSVGKSETRIGLRPMEKNNRYKIVFVFHNIEAKSNNVFTLAEAEQLRDKGELRIKYIGKKAIIIENLD